MKVPENHEPRLAVPTRICVLLLPVYVGSMTLLSGLFGFDWPTARIPGAIVIGLTILSLLVFALMVRFIDRWVRLPQPPHDGRKAVAGNQTLNRHRSLTEFLTLLTGVPNNRAFGYFVGLAVSGIVSVTLNLTALLTFHGTSIALQIPINMVAYTSLFAVATFINYRSSSVN